jgi:hypothetical protein
MGEYARRLDGQRVKIGTCESMYYLRFDQRSQVRHESGNVDPNGQDMYELRFRFPWPEEDHEAPGDFSQWPYEKTQAVHGAVPFPEFEHYPVQFTASAGYCMSIPCPESLPGATGSSSDRMDFHGAKIFRNGFPGRLGIAYQKPLRDGTLCLVVRCGGCGAMVRLEEWKSAEPVVVALRAEADRHPDQAKRLHVIADRIAAGYEAQRVKAASA